MNAWCDRCFLIRMQQVDSQVCLYVDIVLVMATSVVHIKSWCISFRLDTILTKYFNTNRLVCCKYNDYIAALIAALHAMKLELLLNMLYLHELSHPACSTTNAIASSENRAMCWQIVSKIWTGGMRSTYFDREDARFIVNVHPILDAMNIGVHFTRERTPSERVAFRGKGSGVVELGV